MVPAQRHTATMLTCLMLVVCLSSAARYHPHPGKPAALTHTDYARAFASAFFDGNDFDKALAAYNKVPASQMKEQDLCNFSMSAFFLQQYSKALAVAQYGLTLYPRQVSLNRVAFFCATELKQYDAALRYAEALFSPSDSVKLSYYDYLYYGRIQTIVKDYPKADSAFAVLAADYPDVREYALYMRAKVNAQMDPDQTKGLACPYYEQLAAILAEKSEQDDTDSERLKECCLYLQSYYFLQRHNQEQASRYARLLLTVDPDNKTALHVLQHP